MSSLYGLAAGWLGLLAQPGATASPAAPEPAVAASPTPTIPSPRRALLTAPGLTPTPSATSPTPATSPAPTTFVIPPRVKPVTPTAHSRLPRGWAVDLTAGTAAPIIVGAAAQVETPPRVLAQLEIGGLVSRYVDLLDAIDARGRRDTPAAGLARDASRNALAIRASVGARPLRRRGLELRAGYTMTSHGQGLTSLGALEHLASVEFDAPDRPLPIRAVVHSLHVDAGWRWVIRQHFVVRAAIGYLHSVAAQMFIAPTFDADGELISRTQTALGELASRAGFSALHAPLLAIYAGYRF